MLFRSEMIYGVVHFSSIALVYQFIMHHTWFPDAKILTQVGIFASIWFLVVATYILLFYPRSLAHRRWVEFRGIVAGVALLITLTFAMFRA